MVIYHMTGDMKAEMPVEVKTNISNEAVVNTAKNVELDVNGIPKLVRKSSGYVGAKDVSKPVDFFKEKVNGTETGMGIYNSVNVIKNIITAPGELFIMKDNGTVFSGINHGIVFVAIIGSILALTGIALGFGNLPVLQVDPTPDTLLTYAFFNPFFV